MQAGEVKDTSDNAVAPGALGTFVIAIAPPDSAGPDVATARRLGTIGAGMVKVAEDYIGELDRNDYYRIDLATLLRLNIKLYNLTGNADLQLYNSAGVRLAYAHNTGAAGESITTDLAAGTYYIRVLYAGSGGTNYRLRLESSAPASAPPVAMDLGNLASGTVRAIDAVIGPDQRNDYYGFHLTQSGRVSIKLYNMLDDADLMILNSAGERIAFSNRSGNSSESLTLDLISGNYYVRVLFAKGVHATGYRLRLEAA